MLKAVSSLFFAGGIKADFECGGLCYSETESSVGANWGGQIMI